MTQPLANGADDGTISWTAQFRPDVSVAARPADSEWADLQALLDDLFDFNRTNLGIGIKIIPSQVI
jgi:hypothetical protein